MKTHKAIYAAAKECQACDLHRNRTNVVLRRGHLRAKIMIIGEAPGEREDGKGLPFVGRSGALLNKMMKEVRLDPEKDVFITNMVKCRPPGNRDPIREELFACRRFLAAQFALVKPKFLVTVGSVAMRSFLRNDDVRIGDVRGDFIWLTKLEVLMLPIYHPSYLLRNPGNGEGTPRCLTHRDLKSLATRLNHLRAGREVEALEATNDLWE
jgi:uracil-DNA glycosylase family 4